MISFEEREWEQTYDGTQGSSMATDFNFLAWVVGVRI